MSDRIRDGHTLALEIGAYGSARLELQCPHDEAPYQTDQLPEAVQLAESENGSILGTYCNICTWVSSTELQDYLHTDVAFFKVESLPIPVEWTLDDDGPRLYPYESTGSAPLKFTPVIQATDEELLDSITRRWNAAKDQAKHRSESIDKLMAQIMSLEEANATLRNLLDAKLIEEAR